ncbi:MAG: DUF3313 domain-containing protein [Methyloceanibacter sp.]|nr:DUF3313 domain-containing protein [Methyloceanibacter sp.]
MLTQVHSGAAIDATMGRSRHAAYTFRPRIVGLLLLTLQCLSGCATPQTTRTGALSSYHALAPSNGVFKRSMARADRTELLAAETIRIVPTRFSDGSGATAFSPRQQRLIANAIDRTVCFDLSDRFVVVPATSPADLTVEVVITNLKPTRPVPAAASKAAAFMTRFLVVEVPVPVPRIPIGLGSLSVEAEARDRTGRQRAAMVWARGAKALGSKTRVAKTGDAYEFAYNFAGDFSRLLITAEESRRLPLLPSARRIRTSLGGPPRYAGCEAFGRSPGIPGFVGAVVGAPPAWTDRSGL